MTITLDDIKVNALSRYMRFVACIALSFLLAGCGRNDRLVAIQAQMRQLEQEATLHKSGSQSNLPTLPTPVKYHFEALPVQTSTKSGASHDQASTAGTDTTSNPLLRYSVEEYIYLGLMQDNDITNAYIKAPNDFVYGLKVGARLGSNNGKVTKITTTYMEVTETPRQANGVQRKVLLKLKD